MTPPMMILSSSFFFFGGGGWGGEGGSRMHCASCDLSEIQYQFYDAVSFTYKFLHICHRWMEELKSLRDLGACQ